MISSNSRLVDFHNKIHLLELVRFITPNSFSSSTSANISTKAPKVHKWVLLRVDIHIPNDKGSGTEQGLIRSPQEVGKRGASVYPIHLNKMIF